MIENGLPFIYATLPLNQKEGNLKFNSLFIIGLAYASAFAGERTLGYLEIDKQVKAVYADGDWANLKKYYKDEGGRRIDIGKTIALEVERDNVIFGTLSTRLHTRVAAVDTKTRLPVRITFHVPDVPYKLSQRDGESRASYAFRNGLGYLKRIHSLDLAGSPDWDGRTISASLTKKEIERLRHEPSISSIELDEISEDLAGGSGSTLTSIFANGYAASLKANAFTDLGYSGRTVYAGMVEWAGLRAADIPTWFGSGILRTRAGTPAVAADDHATYVLGTVRNAHSAATIGTFMRGGAFNLKGLSHMTRLSNEKNYFNAYGWASSGAYYGNLTNSSWRYYRWQNSASASAQNAHDRYWDIHASDYPYMCNVVLAGNEGSTQPVAWWGHNNIVVGSIDYSGIVSSFSSYINGSTGDEVPHVMAVGESIQYPDGKFKSGTSFSTPAITALISDFYDRYPGLTTAPEVTKAAVLASAISRPVDDESYSRWKDTKGGFGIPDGYLLDAIGKNGYSSSSPLPPGNYGCFQAIFTEVQGNGTMKTYQVTSTAPANSYIHVVTTWFSNPEGTCTSGSVCWADDIDLAIFNSAGQLIASSDPVKNTTERVQFLKTESGPVTYTVQLKLYNRITNKMIPTGTAWTYSTTQIPVP
jgi:Subtilase family